MGTAEYIRACRVRAGKSAPRIAADLGLNDAWYRDLELHDDELVSTLTLLQALQLASILGVRLPELLMEDAASCEKIALLDLPAIIKNHIAAEGISIQEFENLVGWELQEFMASPVKVATEVPLMFLQDLSGVLGIRWLSLLPDEEVRFMDENK